MGVRTSGRVGVLPHFFASENIIHLLALHLRARGHLLSGAARKGLSVSLECSPYKTPQKSRTCLVIGNSYAQVLHAHLLCPVSAEMTSRFAQLGQKSMAAVWRKGLVSQGAGPPESTLPSANLDRPERFVGFGRPRSESYQPSSGVGDEMLRSDLCDPLPWAYTATMSLLPEADLSLMCTSTRLTRRESTITS